MLDALFVNIGRFFQRDDNSDFVIDKLRRIRQITGTEITRSEAGFKHLIKTAEREKTLVAANYLWNREYQEELHRSQNINRMLGDSFVKIRPGDPSVKSSLCRKGF